MQFTLFDIRTTFEASVIAGALRLKPSTIAGPTQNEAVTHGRTEPARWLAGLGRSPQEIRRQGETAAVTMTACSLWLPIQR
jgi:hypothetical protein